MTAYVLVDARIYYNEFDISGLLNSTTIEYNADTPDASVFAGDGTRRRISGLIDVAVNSAGYIDQSDKDKSIYERIGNTEAADLTVAAENAMEGSRAYFLKVHQGTYNILGGIGEVAPFTLDTKANHRLVRGIVGAVGVKDSDGTSSVFDLGPVLAGDSIFSVLHVISAEGTTPTLDVVIKSSTAKAFGSPTDRITFGAVKGKLTHQLLSEVGPLTDRYWRVDWEIAGTDPEYDILIALGVWKNPS